MKMPAQLEGRTIATITLLATGTRSLRPTANSRGLHSPYRRFSLLTVCRDDGVRRRLQAARFDHGKGGVGSGNADERWPLRARLDGAPEEKRRAGGLVNA